MRSSLTLRIDLMKVLHAIADVRRIGRIVSQPKLVVSVPVILEEHRQQIVLLNKGTRELARLQHGQRLDTAVLSDVDTRQRRETAKLTAEHR